MSRPDGKGMVFDIQRFSLHDGPGIRTAVFFKGCPLRCPWCQNPESWEKAPQLMYNENRCLLCGKCKEACSLGAVQFAGGQGNDRAHFQRDFCRRCESFNCVNTCSGGALRVAGYWMEAKEVVREARKDAPFYENSGGGVTLTGGEPLFQPRFAREILKGCQDEGIHTAVETCGLAAEESFKDLFPFLDLVLYDLKILDPEKHYQVTGCDNALIRENARSVIRAGKPVCFRVPLVPWFTDGEDNLASIGNFLKEEGFDGPVELLPYHQFGLNKFFQLGMEPPEGEIVEPARERVTKAKTVLQSLGLQCVVGNEK